MGILATSGTLAVGLYQQALIEVGLTPVLPIEDEIAQIMDAIYGASGIKTCGASAGNRAQLAAAGERLLERGAQALILGCTELPLALNDGDLPAPLIASNQVLAEAAVKLGIGDGVE